LSAPRCKPDVGGDRSRPLRASEMMSGISVHGPFFDGGWSCQGHGPHALTIFVPTRSPQTGMPSRSFRAEERSRTRTCGPIGLVLEGSEHGRMEFGMQVCPPRLNGSKGPPPHSTGSAATIDTRRAEMRSGSAAPQAQESVTRPPGGGHPNPPRAQLHVPEDERLTNEPACAQQRFSPLSEVLETGSA